MYVIPGTAIPRKPGSDPDFRSVFRLIGRRYPALRTIRGYSKGNPQMNRTTLTALACAAMLSFAAAPACAQTTSGLNRIGVVNPDRILSESVPALRAQERIKAEFAKREGELAGMASQLQRLQAELERDGITMAQLDRQRKERAFNDLTQEFQKKKRSFEEDLEERRNTAMQEVSEQADRVIRQVAQQEKFDIIMREAVYASPRVDITDKVIEALAGGAKPAAKK